MKIQATNFSRHFQNIKDKDYTVGDLGAWGNKEGLFRNTLNMNLIPMIDQEQLHKAPSSEDWWTRRKSQLLGAQDNETICPCLSTMFRTQAEEMQRIITPRGSLDLTLASHLDEQQLMSASNRRASLPLDRFVSILDDQQRENRGSNEAIIKAIDQIKRLKCDCEGKDKDNLRLPVVNIIPSTPQFHRITSVSHNEVDDHDYLAVIEADNAAWEPIDRKKRRKHRKKFKSL